MFVVANISKILSEEFSIQELINLVSDLSRLHRIQGCSELEKAGDYIKKCVEEAGPFRVNLKKYNYGVAQGSFGPVVGWDIEDGELRLIKPREELLHSFKNSRTLIAAHSPSGEVEGEVVHVGDGEDPKSYEKVSVEGKIVLAYGYAYIVYMQALRKGASGVLVYRRSGIENGVPYMGLFLTPSEAENARAPAMTVSRRTAMKLIRMIERGERPVVKMIVKANYRSEAWIPVITAEIGEGDSEVHLCAHYCHPAGTVNDNISGTAALLELALAYARSISKGKLLTPNKHKIKFIWFPEYAGSLAYMINEKPKVVFSINLDMIGEKQELTGSTINFVKPPPRLYHPYEAAAYYCLKKQLSLSESFSSPRKALTYRLDVVPYEMGSDHDIYLQFNVPAVMINQWPDKYYHSDLDTIDKFDPQLAKLITIGIGEAIYMSCTSKSEEEVKKMAKSYFYESIGRELSETDPELHDIRYKFLVKTIGEATLEYTHDNIIGKIVKAIEVNKSTEKAEKYIYKGPPGTVPTRTIYRKTGWDGYSVLKKIFEKNRYMRTVVSSLIPMYMRKPKSLSELKKMVEEDYGVKVEIEPLREAIEVLMKADLIEKVS